LLDRAVKERGVLLHQRDLPAHPLRVERPQIVAADCDLAFLRVVKPQEEARDGGFAASARTHDAKAFPRGNGEGEAVEGGSASARIGETDILEGDGGRKGD